MTTEPRPVRAVIFPTDPDEPVRVETVDASPGGRWALLGGQDESVFLGEGVPGALFCHAYGKTEGLPVNGRATRFVDHYRTGYARADLIHGPAIVTGFDDIGLPVDVPADVEGAATTG